MCIAPKTIHTHAHKYLSGWSAHSRTQARLQSERREREEVIKRAKELEHAKTHQTAAAKKAAAGGGLFGNKPANGGGLFNSSKTPAVAAPADGWAAPTPAAKGALFQKPAAAEAAVAAAPEAGKAQLFKPKADAAASPAASTAIVVASKASEETLQAELKAEAQVWRGNDGQKLRIFSISPCLFQHKFNERSRFKYRHYM